MTWTKLSDDFADDCWTLSDEAFRLHVEGLLWSNRKLVDLRVSKADVRRFAKHPEAASELVAVGWWEECGDYYVIRHHAIYQRTREAVVKQQEANSANGRIGGRKVGKPRELASDSLSKPPSESLSESLSERDRTGRGLEGDEFSATDLLNENDQNDTTAEDDADAAWTERRPPPPGRLCPECNQPLDAGMVRHRQCFNNSMMGRKSA